MAARKSNTSAAFENSGENNGDDTVLGRWPQDDDELWEFVTSILGVKIPRVQVCPNHVAPFTLFADAFFNRHPTMIVKASRGLAGKSYLLASLGVIYMIVQGAAVTILGGSGAQSENVQQYATDHWDYEDAPRELLLSQPSRFFTYLKNGGKMRALLASQRSVRGPHPQKLLLDEIDEMDVKILDAALGQPMGKPGIPGQTIMSSTHHNPNGTMTEILKRAPEKGWPVFEWCYRECMEPHGWLPEEEIARKRTQVTALMWDVEYELQEPSIEGRAILPEAVEAMFTLEQGKAEGQEGEYLEFEAPEPFVYYATGTDWARKVHHTVIVTFRTDCIPWRLVAYERMQDRGWPEMIDRLNARVSRYPGTAAHDATGLGDVVSSYLTEPVDDIMMVGRPRQNIFSEYVVAVERGELVSPRIASMYNAHKYCRNQDLYGSGSQDHAPDDVVAGAIAWHVRDQVPGDDYGPQAHGERTVRPNP